MNRQVLPRTSPAYGRYLRPSVLLVAPVFLTWFVAVWLGVALSPFLFNADPSQGGKASVRRTTSLSRTAQMIATARTFASALHYVLQPDPTETPASSPEFRQLAARPMGFSSNSPNAHLMRTDSGEEPSTTG
jgi:hypothetical protein